MRLQETNGAASSAPLTAREAARETGFAASTLVRAVREGRLSAIQLGRHGQVRFTREQLAELKNNPQAITHPVATLGQLWQRLELLEGLSRDRANEVEALKERLVKLENPK